MTLTLTLRTQPPARIAAAALIPERLRGLDATEVSALTVRCGRRTLNVGDLFEVSGTGDEQLAFAGDLRRVDGIGAGCRAAGCWWRDRAVTTSAARMRGGEIVVDGDAGAWAGAEMAGGTAADPGRCRRLGSAVRIRGPALA